MRNTLATQKPPPEKRRNVSRESNYSYITVSNSVRGGENRLITIDPALKQ
jgi:hypothetical protein